MFLEWIWHWIWVGFDEGDEIYGFVFLYFGACCVCIVSMLCLILNFLGLCLILNLLGLCLYFVLFLFLF